MTRSEEAPSQTRPRRNAVRSRQLLASALALLLLPIPTSAQTAEVQREVETRLWFMRALAWVEEATGVPPHVALLTLLALALGLAAAVWLWRARRKDGTE